MLISLFVVCFFFLLFLFILREMLWNNNEGDVLFIHFFPPMLYDFIKDMLDLDDLYLLPAQSACQQQEMYAGWGHHHAPTACIGTEPSHSDTALLYSLYKAQMSLSFLILLLLPINRLKHITIETKQNKTKQL